MSAQQEPVALRTAVLPGHHQRVLRVARRVARRKVHALEVVVVGFDLWPHAHRVAQRGKNAGDFIQRAGDGVLGSGQPLGSWQRNVDGLGLESRVGGSRAQRRVQQSLDHGFESVEAHPQQLFGLRRSGLQPAAGDLVEQALLAPQPLQPEGLDRRFAAELRGRRARLLLQLGKGPVQRGLIKCRQIGNFDVHSVKVRINHRAGLNGLRLAGGFKAEPFAKSSAGRI